MKRVRTAAIILAVVGVVIGASPVRADAQGASPFGETVADALARNVRVLASQPKDFNALIGAGRAALQMGDPQSAAGFYARAEEVYPASPLPQMGMGAALVAGGDAREALGYFTRAQQLGGSAASFGADRGLAYDLLGMPGAAQADYRAALAGPDRNEAQRRLALSQAIGGDKQAALATLQPLLSRRDPGAARVRSLVLALAGDVVGAKAALDSMIPGASRRMEPFFHRLPSLTAPQKAAAVHLGVFPDIGGSAYASAGQPSGPSLGQSSSDDRLASIDFLLKSQPPQAVPVAPQLQYSPPARIASAPARPIAPSHSSKVWLQLASGSNVAALPDQFRRIKRSTRDLLDGIDAHVAEENDRVRLLIGPFKDIRDATIFAEDLQALRVDAFRWTNPPGHPVRKLPLE